MNTVENNSNTAEDSRSIHTIIFEKANFGAVPTGYRLSGDSRWHPVAWHRNEFLVQLQFSDGTTIQVNGKPSDTYYTDEQLKSDGAVTRPFLGIGFPGNEAPPSGEDLPDETVAALDSLSSDAVQQVTASLNEVGSYDAGTESEARPAKGGSLLRPATAASENSSTKEIAERFKPKGNA